MKGEQIAPSGTFKNFKTLEIWTAKVINLLLPLQVSRSQRFKTRIAKIALVGKCQANILRHLAP